MNYNIKMNTDYIKVMLVYDKWIVLNTFALSILV